jgi:RimJ/RimL family protein N-acetyltransferase
MITPLALQDYPHVRPLFHALDDHLAVAAILAGDVPAHVYADDPRHPQVALLVPWNPQRLYRAGTTENAAFNRAAAEVVTARYALHSPAPAAFVVYPAPGGWEQRIAALVPGAATVYVPRQYFRLKRLQVAWRTLIPAGLTMRRVDAPLFAEGLRHTEALSAEIQSESPSVADFLRTQVGYCVQHEDAIVGWCLSEYTRAGRCEVGIETLAGYRRRGIATLTAAALIEDVLAHGITTIGWHCWASNVGSRAVAANVGFEQVREYGVWYCELRGNAR